MSSRGNKIARNKRHNVKLHQLSTYVAEDVQVDLTTTENVIKLLENDNTVPFIARYRRKETGDLEVEKIRMIQESFTQVKAVEDRKLSVIKAIGYKLTPEIQYSIEYARTLQDIEEIYAPLKTGSKGTLANRARKLGLDKAVETIQANPGLINLNRFINCEVQGLSNTKKVYSGVQHILADIISKDKDMCDTLKDLFESSHITMDTKVHKASKGDKKYKEYHEKSIPVKWIKAHQVLAINRAEESKIIHVKVNCPQQVQQRFSKAAIKKYISSNCSEFVRNLTISSVDDCFNRLMLPKIVRHKRAELTKKAEREAAKVFSGNLRRLLLTPPVQGRNVLGIDPGFTNGCKIAVVNNNGDILDTCVIYPFSGNSKAAEAKLQGLLTTHNCHTIALGNGKACRETELFITKMKETEKLKRNVVYSIVNEDGASIYSISEEAETEMPLLDINLRSAVSIARRLQNPLLELIKIEPKHLGIGMYQHDIPDNLLKTALSGVLEDCVSLVGVDLNASGVHALKRIAGLNEKKAKEIVAWRQRNGGFSNREQLKKVRGIGEKTFEQCVGFLRILGPFIETIVIDSDEDAGLKSEPGQFSGKRKAEGSGVVNKKRKYDNPVGYNRLDSTCIHPESYPVAERLLALTGASPSYIGQPRMQEKINHFLAGQEFSSICETVNSDSATVRLIINGLCQSLGSDIRADFAQPLFRCGVISVKDIKSNTRMTGRVTNVTTFGTFVDIGVERHGMIHNSKIPPSAFGVIGVGDIVEVTVEEIDTTDNKIKLRLLDIKNSNVKLQ